MENNYIQYVEGLGEMKELKSKLYQEIIVDGLKNRKEVNRSLDGIIELSEMVNRLMDLIHESAEGSLVKADGIKYIDVRINDVKELLESLNEQQALVYSKLFN